MDEWTERTNSLKMNIMDLLIPGFSFYIWAVKKNCSPVQNLSVMLFLRQAEFTVANQTIYSLFRNNILSCTVL